MRKLYSPLLALSGAIATGAVWTVGQTGPQETNAHLCEFVGRYLPDTPPDCGALDLTVRVAGWLFVASLFVAIAKIAWIATGWRRGRRTKGAEAASVLEIHFDPANPARRFWSLEAPRDREGTRHPGVVHEYRVDIHNPTMRTIRNVSVTVEHAGDMGSRPTDAFLDKTWAQVFDLKPGCAELATILRWPHPKIQPGMLAGPSALCYGPIVVIASGDDIPPTCRIFWFDYQREPMIFDKLEPGEELRAIDRPTPV
ncbi:hypothetical protein [Methylobacterium pseudosasicola]|uniref:Uncharacterized protein n=1 Tax=Methylobacterium pseudosasicola TaxID=582667 RepID=A0A1I4U4D2_9HYPH|nr:hypothetical protein [Methylobacterium pseudosasicola]SFM83862.1 hypothetical protein SAMN05192568_10639 [Methylobacterium pseudosasicola]